MACTVQRIRADDLHFLLANPIAHVTMNIRPLDRADLAASAQVHADSFTRQREPLAWVTSTSKAYPRFRYFVAESDGSIVGYIVWGEKSGFPDFRLPL
jgi:L-amino acid N-acyltransferase YncA